MVRQPDDALSERRGYHHGQLRTALVEAARRLIAERGPAGFTLSDAAKLAGVSPAAPYRHFRDRQALLVEVAKQGFEALGQRLAAAGRSEGDGFAAMGKAYLAFARDEPAFYAAMFNTGRSEGAVSTGDDDPGFALLRQAIAKVLGDDDPARVQQAAVLVFALTHGLASLVAAAPATVPGGVGDPEAALQVGVEALLHGLTRISA